MKKQKLTLNNLKVESFVTNLDENIVKTLQGGAVDAQPGPETRGFTNCEYCGNTKVWPNACKNTNQCTILTYDCCQSIKVC